MVQEDSSIQQQRFDFVGIAQINDYDKDSYVDVCAVVLSVSELSTITSSRTQKEITKRTMTLVDRTDASIELTIWGKEAEQYTEASFSDHPVIAVKGCRVSDFGGRSLSTVSQDLALAHS